MSRQPPPTQLNTMLSIIDTVSVRLPSETNHHDGFWMNAERLAERIAEAKARLEEVSRASYQNIDDALRRYEHALSRDGLVPTALANALAKISFDDWYTSVSATKGGMVGSAKLTWPLEPDERVALQYLLVQRITAGEIDLTDFTYTFTYERNNFDDNNRAFFERILVPFHNDLIRVLEPQLKEIVSDDEVSEPESAIGSTVFIDPVRIAELKSLTASKFDVSRVVQYCVELDSSYRNGCYLAVSALTRALMDHVPPVFDCNGFAEIANNYGGSKSFKTSMKHLSSSARAIGDSHLHTQIRKTEVLPTATQVNFANDLDVLLAEVVRILKANDT